MASLAKDAAKKGQVITGLSSLLPQAVLRMSGRRVTLAPRLGNHLTDSGNPNEDISGSPPVALIGVFPPPMGGQAIYNIQLASEIRRAGWSIVEIDLSPAGSSISSSKHAPTRKALIKTLMKEPFKLYHLSASDSRAFGFELIVATFSILRRVPFVYNLLAGRFGERSASYPLLKRLLLCAALRRAGCILVSNSNQLTQIKSLEFLSNAPVKVVA